MTNIKNRAKYDLKNKLKWFISNIFILFQKSLQRVKSSNPGTKSLKVKALSATAWLENFETNYSYETKIADFDKCTQSDKAGSTQIPLLM